MLRVVKALNNNIVLAIDRDNQEIVAFGTGIGFKKRKGDSIEEDNITKRFYSTQNSSIEKQILAISPKVLGLTEKIITYGESKLNKKLSSVLLFSLADHLEFALKNYQYENHNPLKWEIPHLYFQEYTIGKKALDFIEEEMKIRLLDEEASFIALHFVTAQIDGQDMSDTIQITQLTKEIVKIIQTIFELTLDKTTINYSRFITHLRYFIIRQKRKQAVSEMDVSLREIIKSRYMKSYACVLIIKDMLKREFNWSILEDELVYLIIHIERITSDQTIK